MTTSKKAGEELSMQGINLKHGLIAGVVNVYIVLVGLIGLAGMLLEDWLNLPSPMPGAWLVLVIVAMWGGTRTIKKHGQVAVRSWGEALMQSLPSALAHGLFIGFLVWLLTMLVASGADLREYLSQLTPENLTLLALGQEPLVGGLLAFLILTAGTLLGAVWAYASDHYRWGAKIKTRSGKLGDSFMNLAPVSKAADYEHIDMVAYGVGLVLLLAAPLILGRYWNYTLGTVGIYVILGLGLNIIVGMAGQLVLGYAAYFAIGAYTVALLTAPDPHGIMMDFWLALPIGVALSALTGVLLGLPVMGMRGDYLAIVTLGFGEIIRILAKSDVLTDFTGGPRGVRSVGGPAILGLDLNNEIFFMYFIMIGILLAAYITYRLQRSRVGRAWMAIRGDEDVAESMGINLLRFKLLAFAMSAAFAGLGGVLFASRNKFTGPEDFTLLVSINVLSLVIIGGMGSIPGVILGALVLKGLPEILRELSDFRMLAFGALLVVMMILRPEGIWPSSRRRMELHEEEEELEIQAEAKAPDIELSLSEEGV
jgi:ABC-type branched-subunit amino acid transport system permease subunit